MRLRTFFAANRYILSSKLHYMQLSGENITVCMVLHAENRNRLGPFGKAVRIQALVSSLSTQLLIPTSFAGKTQLSKERETSRLSGRDVHHGQLPRNLLPKT